MTKQEAATEVLEKVRELTDWATKFCQEQELMPTDVSFIILCKADQTGTATMHTDGDNMFSMLLHEVEAHPSMTLVLQQVITAMQTKAENDDLKKRLQKLMILGAEIVGHMPEDDPAREHFMQLKLAVDEGRLEDAVKLADGIENMAPTEEEINAVKPKIVPMSPGGEA